MQAAAVTYLLLYSGLIATARVVVDPVAWLQNADRELGVLMRDSALRTWQYMIGDPQSIPSSLNISLSDWKEEKCHEAMSLPPLPPLMARAMYLLCRGPRFNTMLDLVMNMVLISLQETYSVAKLCDEWNHCYHGEPDLERLMAQSRDPSILLWAWEGWRRVSNKDALETYPQLVDLENRAARKNGYSDMGECWRQELEIDNFEGVVETLLAEVEPFHRLLHAFVRHRLRQYYGPHLVSETGPIPAHLLGNMWSYAWGSLLDIMVNSTLDLDNAAKKKFNNVSDILLEAEKYYVSMGLDPMTDKFWKNSKILRTDKPGAGCHGTAANMYSKDDYRMLVCASVSWNDFYIVLHEMGHCEYYKAYEDQPTVFKDPPNSAFQEAIGDLMMLAVETPSNLKRMGVVGEKDDVEIPLLLYQALKKIPHIRFAYVVDKWRWGVMAGNISVEQYNKIWWEYRFSYEGVVPPTPREPGSFDAIAKFHIADNTPYIRYFLSEFLQFQMLEVMCEMKNDMHNEDYPLHLCDLHGFLPAGKRLRKLMSRGAMYKWDEVLAKFSRGMFTQMSARPLLRYFQPLIHWLQEQIDKEGIPLGW